MTFDLVNSIDVLRRTPPTLTAFLGGLAEPLVRGTEGPETFSPSYAGFLLSEFGCLRAANLEELSAWHSLQPSWISREFTQRSVQ